VLEGMIFAPFSLYITGKDTHSDLVNLHPLCRGEFSVAAINDREESAETQTSANSVTALSCNVSALAAENELNMKIRKGKKRSN
jgi:hypothetical protein